MTRTITITSLLEGSVLSCTDLPFILFPSLLSLDMWASLNSSWRNSPSCCSQHSGPQRSFWWSLCANRGGGHHLLHRLLWLLWGPEGESLHGHNGKDFSQFKFTFALINV